MKGVLLVVLAIVLWMLLQTTVLPKFGFRT